MINEHFEAIFNAVATAQIVFQQAASTCQGYSGDEAGSIIYMVIDDIENSRGIKNVWISMLLAAEARGTTIDFHATVKGTNSRGFQVVTPYFLGSH